MLPNAHCYHPVSFTEVLQRCYKCVSLINRLFSRNPRKAALRGGRRLPRELSTLFALGRAVRVGKRAAYEGRPSSVSTSAVGAWAWKRFFLVPSPCTLALGVRLQAQGCWLMVAVSYISEQLIPISLRCAFASSTRICLNRLQLASRNIAEAALVSDGVHFI